VSPGHRLQAFWRWNGRPVRVRLRSVDGGWEVTWERWFPRPREWRRWRVYIGGGSLREVIARYRDYAAGWRGLAG
jgi:hypothetical protein